MTYIREQRRFREGRQRDPDEQGRGKGVTPDSSDRPDASPERECDGTPFLLPDVKHLYDEVLRRFPKVASYVSKGDEELPYVVVGYITDWLLSVELDPATVQRIVDFDRWCMDQPSGETAAEDVMTIEVIALREKLFEHDKLLPIVPRLMSRKELLQNKEYLTKRFGADRYQAALRLSGGVG